MVLAGDLAPGERVVELDLAARLRVSRTPLRLAFTELERAGVLERLPKRGYRVRRVALEEVVQAIDVRGVLEGYAARRAAESGMSANLLEDMRGYVQQGRALINEARRKPPLNASHWMSINMRFHQVLMDAAGNQVLVAALSHVTKMPLAAPVAVALGGAAPQLELEFLERAQSDHEDILQALEAREGARAEALLREHARRSRDNKCELIKRSLERVPFGTESVRSVAMDDQGRSIEK